MAKLTSRSGLIAGYTSAIVVMLIGCLVFYGARQLTAAYRGVFESQQLFNTVRMLDEQLHMAEVEHRRYLITGDEEAASNYERARLSQPVILGNLRSLINALPQFDARVDTLAYFARLRLAELDHEVRKLLDGGGAGIANAQVLSAPGRSESMRKFEQLASAMYAQIEAEGANSWYISQRELNGAVIVALLGGLAAVALIVVFTVVYRRQTHYQQKIYGELELQSQALQHQAAEARAANAELEVATTEMVVQAAEAEANQLRLSGILSSATDAIVSFDDDRRLVYMNAAASRLLGVNAEEAVGQEITSFVSNERREQFSSYISTTRFALPPAHDEVRRWEIMVSRPDGETVPVEISIAYAAATGRQGLYTAVMRDVSRQRQLEEQLRQSQKMEAVGRLAGGIAHDFNNLLTVIGASSDFILQTKSLQSESIREDLHEIRKATDRAAALTRQLLAFSRRQLIHPQLTDLNGIVDEMKSMLQRLIGEDIDLKTSYEAELDSIRIDRGQLEQVIANLSVNARDSMPNGGVLEIRTEAASKNEYGSIAADGDTGSGFVVLVVKDSGVGMDRETQARIFEPFFTTKERGKGTGLGLPTVYGIVKQAGGDIVVESEPGQGTEFRLYFPRVQQQAEGEEPVVNMRSQSFLGTETILVVEDEESLRHLARRILQSRGYTVLEAANGKDAISVMARHGQQVDLVLSDVVMPIMGGRELVERLLPIYPMLRVLFMTGYTEDTLLKHRIAELGITVLEKPFTPESLAKSVRIALDRGRLRRPTLVQTKSA